MIGSIKIDEYIYSLPEDRIAKYPLAGRDGSKLLVYDRGQLSRSLFRELPDLLSPEMHMVFNDTRVVQARLGFEKTTGSRIEIFCLEPYDPADYNLAFQCRGSVLWKCLVGNAKKWKEGQLEKRVQTGVRRFILKATRAGRDKDAFLIRFDWEPAELNFGEILNAAGTMPIPPYLNRKAEEADKNTYQTVYSRVEGSVAAPTAGLHFTDPVLREIADSEIRMTNLTLHVGAGTFQPLISGRLEDHPMHAEHLYVKRQAIEELLDQKNDLLSVGTTTTRVPETIYWLGCKIKHMGDPRPGPLFLDQWEAYSMPDLSREISLGHLLEFMNKSGLDHLEAVTRLMIVPGYTFRMCDRMITNFHQPKSTLLLLVAAFIGEDWREVYRYAMENDFRFLSYGDSSILVPKKS